MTKVTLTLLLALISGLSATAPTAQTSREGLVQRLKDLYGSHDLLSLLQFFFAVFAAKTTVDAFNFDNKKQARSISIFFKNFFFSINFSTVKFPSKFLNNFKLHINDSTALKIYLNSLKGGFPVEILSNF